MVPRVLDLLGRRHDPDNVVSAVEAIRAVGFASFNVDLIYGAATETLDEWRTTLRGALALDPPHVSAYGLTVEAGTPLAADPARHPDDDVQADEYELADDLLTAAGLANYEVSNWARPGHECRHNLLYWRQHDYLGFGCAAHSHVAGRRWWNVRTPERYIAAVAAGRPTEAAGETLDAETRRIEGLQLSLRTTAGVPRDALDGERSTTSSPARRPLGAHPPRPPARQRGGGPPALISAAPRRVARTRLQCPDWQGPVLRTCGPANPQREPSGGARSSVG